MSLDTITVRLFLDGKREPRIDDGVNKIVLDDEEKRLLLTGAKEVYLGDARYKRKVDIASKTSLGLCRTITYERVK